MGYLTTITIKNDALHEFKKYPEEFAKALFNGMNEANNEHKEISVPFSGYCNYIEIQPSRHADATTVYVHYGNTVFNLDAWGDDFLSLVNRDPKIAMEFVKAAESTIKECKKVIKEKLAKTNA